MRIEDHPAPGRARREGHRAAAVNGPAMSALIRSRLINLRCVRSGCEQSQQGSDAPALAYFAPNRCRDQIPKRPVMQSRGITPSFHREMADSSRELVGPDVSATVIFESDPRFIKGGFQDYEGLGIKRSTADSKHVPSVRSGLPGQRLLEPPPESSRIFGITWRFS